MFGYFSCINEKQFLAVFPVSIKKKGLATFPISIKEIFIKQVFPLSVKREIFDIHRNTEQNKKEKLKYSISEMAEKH